MKTKKRMTTQTIVFGAFLVAIAFLLGGGFARVTGIPLTLHLNFGGASQSIGFTAVPLVIGSIVLGPMGGSIVAVIYDTLSYLLITGGAWNPIFTLSEMMIGLLPGLIYGYFKHHSFKHSLFGWLSIGLAAYTFLVILLSSFMGAGKSDAQKSVQMISFQGGVHIVNGILLAAFLLCGVLSILLLWYFCRKRGDHGLFSYDKLYLVTFLGMSARSLISGWGLWLYMGRTVPLIFYWLPRFVTPMFMVPLIAFVISCLGYVLKRYTRV